MPVIVVGEVPDASVKLCCQLLVRSSPCLVIVKQAVDALILMQHVNGFRYIGGGVENDIILPVKVGYGRAVSFPQREEGEIVRHALEYQTFLPRFSRLPDVADVFRCDAALEELVAHFKSSCHIRKADGEIGLTVMDEVQFLTRQFRKCSVYPTLLQIAKQCRMHEFHTLQLLEGWFGCLLTKKERNGRDVWSLFRYLTEQIGHMV